MGTRALIHIKENDRTLVTIYKHMDGYPSYLGKLLKDFLSNRYITNGISRNDKPGAFDGMGCLAASLIGHLKTGCGGVYIYPPDSSGVGEEYTYTLYAEGDVIMICVSSGAWEVKCSINQFNPDEKRCGECGSILEDKGVK